MQTFTLVEDLRRSEVARSNLTNRLQQIKQANARLVNDLEDSNIQLESLTQTVLQRNREISVLRGKHAEYDEDPLLTGDVLSTWSYPEEA